MKTVLIDADSLVYAAAAVAEKRSYLVHRGGAVSGPYDTKRDALAELEKDSSAAIYHRLELSDFDSALIRLRASLARIKTHAQQRYGKVKIETYLSGTGNFRERIPCKFPYKGNRVNVERPQYLHRLKRELINSGAMAVHFMEPDDLIAIRLTEDPDAIACSIDKDIKQVPGVHMIPDSGFITVSPRSALLRLYAQIIGGDATDGVPGCYRVSADGAQKLLFSHVLKTDTLEQTAKKFWRVAVDCYKTSIAKHGARDGHAKAEDAAVETARFVYLLRERPKDLANIKLWEPPI